MWHINIRNFCLIGYALQMWVVVGISVLSQCGSCIKLFKKLFIISVTWYYCIYYKTQSNFLDIGVVPCLPNKIQTCPIYSFGFARLCTFLEQTQSLLDCGILDVILFPISGTPNPFFNNTWSGIVCRDLMWRLMPMRVNVLQEMSCVPWAYYAWQYYPHRH